MLTSSGVALRVAPRGRLMPVDPRVEEPRVHQPGSRIAGSVSLRCSLIWCQTSRLISAGVHCFAGLPVSRPGRVPVGDVDREAVDRVAVAVVGREVALGPELRLGERGQRPLGVDVGDVAVGDVDPLAQEELDARHPVGVELVDPLERRVGAQQLAATAACGRARPASPRRTSRRRSAAGARAGRASHRRAPRRRRARVQRHRAGPCGSGRRASSAVAPRA